MAQSGRGAGGQGADDRTTPGARGVASDQRRRLGAHCRDAASVGAKAVELRSTVSPRWAGVRHRNADWNFARRCAREQGQRGRLVVDLQPDGDLMYDAGALWMAAKYQIPLLIVMYNNRAYYNDWNHQIVMARTRGTDPSLAHIGMDLFGPAPDFGGLARSMGWWAEGPIENADDLQPALERAVAQVKTGKPALVDAVTQHR